jgi:small subunit ribosomal protein S6
MSNKYEAMYIIDAAIEEEARKALIERFNTLITDNGGTLSDIDEWGKRRLAYPIDYKNEGYYVLLHFEAAPEFPRELERNLQISDGVIRYLVTRVEE